MGATNTLRHIGDDTIDSQGSIAAVIRTAGPDPSGGRACVRTGRLDGRDSELTCVCSRTGVSSGPDRLRFGAPLQI